MLDSRRQANDGCNSCHKAERHQFRPYKERQRNASSGNSHIAQVINEVITVTALAVVGFVIQVEISSQTEEVNASVLLE